MITIDEAQRNSVTRSRSYSFWWRRGFVPRQGDSGVCAPGHEAILPCALGGRKTQCLPSRESRCGGWMLSNQVIEQVSKYK